VVGVDDERFGQAVTAVVAAEAGSAVTGEKIVAAVKDELAGYKAPRHVVFVAAVPRAPNGKADHKTARQHAVAALSAAVD
jgi:fatty-acyl-CoA synthase